jgi:hypothetical protein
MRLPHWETPRVGGRLQNNGIRVDQITQVRRFADERLRNNRRAALARSADSSQLVYTAPGGYGLESMWPSMAMWLGSFPSCWASSFTESLPSALILLLTVHKSGRGKRGFGEDRLRCHLLECRFWITSGSPSIEALGRDGCNRDPEHDHFYIPE